MKKQFAIDVQANGGIDNFLLGRFAKGKEKSYGQPNTKQRKQFVNLLQRWKGKTRSEYNGFLLNPDYQSPERVASANRQAPNSSTRRSATRRTQQAAASPPPIQRTNTVESPRPFLPRAAILQQQLTMANQHAANLLNLPHGTISFILLL